MNVSRFGSAGAAVWMDELIVLLILLSGVAAGWVVSRASGFYRAMLRSDAALAPTDGRVRYDTIDGLRGACCLMVIVGHSAATLWLPLASFRLGDAGRLAPTAFKTGGLAVGLFFAITAFLFYGRVVESNRATPAGRFLVGRAARIGPALVMSGLLIFLVDACTIRALTPAHPAEFLRMTAKLVSLGAVGTGIVQHNAYVYWTLPYEWMFYFAMPVLAAAVPGGVPTWARLLACFAMASLASGVIGRSGPAMMFVPGIVAAHLVDRPAVRRLASSSLGSACVVGLAVAFPFATVADSASFLAASIVGVAFTLIVAGCDAFGLLRLDALRAVGMASYSVYLLHGIVLFTARPLLLRWGGPTPCAWAAVLGCTVVTVLASFASYRWIEHPGIELGRRLTRRPATVV